MSNLSELARHPLLEKMEQQAKGAAYTWNGAISNATTGDPLLDYWSKAGTYAGRSQADVDKDMARLFATGDLLPLRAVFGLRLITRKPRTGALPLGDEVQTGHGRKDEFRKAFAWLAKHKPHLAYENLHLVPVFGCWKDLLEEPLTSAVSREAVYKVCAGALDDPLLRKFLPQIKRSGKRGGVVSRTRKCGYGSGHPRKNAPTPRALARMSWVQGFLRHLGITEKEYRKLKAQGAAHLWQRQVSNGMWEAVDFKNIPGKAMLKVMSKTGRDGRGMFERHGQLDRPAGWVAAQKTIKFQGYPHDLARAALEAKNTLQRLVYDKQFESLLEPMRGHYLGNVLCCLDVSGSMTWVEVAPKVRPLDVCLAMGVVFSALNTGHFKDHVCAFSATSTLHELKGGFCERIQQARATGGCGNTNFQSVIDLLVRTRQANPAIPPSEYPETLLVISDMQFDVAASDAQTNYEAARAKLRVVGLPDVRFVWWQVNGAAKDFPSKMDDKGVYMISGFDPVNIKALMGLTAEKRDFQTQEKKQETPMDGMLNFLNQPIFDLLVYG